MFLRSAISFLTLTAFLVHAVWGCCAHHTHAAEPTLSGAAEHGHPVNVAACDIGRSDGTHEAVHERQGAADEKPCENHEHPHQPDCGDESCSFAVSSQVKLPTANATATIATVALGKSSLSVVQAANQAALDHPRGARSADRARQLLQVWLL